MTTANKWITNIQAALFPSRCVLCGDPGMQNLDLCQGCLNDLPRNQHACRFCALPLTEGSSKWQCGSCLKKSPPYDSCFAPLHYQYPVDHLLTQLKFHQKLSLARLLGTLMAQWLTQSTCPELLIPVPLHSSRLRERGYNQALELTRPIARKLQIPIDTKICRRERATSAQTNLQIKQRSKNVQGAFSLTGKLYAKHVVIIDDVVTTGHTINEVANVLRQAGAEQIDVWSCARASLRN